MSLPENRRGSEVRPPAGGQGRGCGAAEEFKKKPAPRPNSATAEGWRAALLRAWMEGLAGLGPAPFCVYSLHSFRAGLYSRRLPERVRLLAPSRDPARAGPRVPSVPQPRSSPPPRAARQWLRRQGLWSLAFNQLSHFHQDFPILCQTCLGKPYIRW